MQIHNEGILSRGLACLVLAAICSGVLAQSRVYNSHPLQLDTSQARPLPFYLPGTLPALPLNQEIPGACCAITLLPGITAYVPMGGMHPGWQGFPYQPPLSVLDGSVTENGRRVYRSGSMYTLESGLDGDGNPGVPVLKRLIVVPGP